MLQHLGLKLEAVGHHQHQPHGLAIGLAIDFQRGNLDRTAFRAEAHDPASVADVGRQLQPGPGAAETGQGNAVQAEVEDFLGAGRIEHRNGAVVQGELALMRDRRTLGNVIVAGQSHRSAMFPRAREIGMAHGIAAAVQAGTLAVPDANGAIVERVRKGLEELAAHDRRKRELFVDAGHEADLVLSEEAAGSLQRQVVTAQGRSLVARDQAACSQALAAVPAHLLDRQADKRLDARHIGRAGFQDVLVIERDGANRHDGYFFAARLRRVALRDGPPPRRIPLASGAPRRERKRGRARGSAQSSGPESPRK